MWRLVLASGLAVVCVAESRVAVQGSAGYAQFIDESDQSHFTAGGSARWYFSRRGAIEPEVLFLYRDASDKDLLLQANVVRDLGSGAGRTVPYLIAGAGRLWNYQPRFTTSTWTAAFGGGARIYFRERYYIAPEARIGGEPIFRLQVSLGWDPRR